MRWRRVVLLSGSGLGLGLGFGLITVSAGLDAVPAGADCSGPTIEYDAGPVDRGQEITVTGTAFGDNCYDTGPPPAGEGLLGRPLTDIAVVITQDGVDHVVAEGNADDDYEFQVSVVVPAELAPGEARVQASGAPGIPAFDLTDQPLVVSDADASAIGALEVVAFGPDGEAPSSGEASAPAESPDRVSADDGSSGWTEPGRWIVAAVIAATVLGVGSMVLVRQR